MKLLLQKNYKVAGILRFYAKDEEYVANLLDSYLETSGKSPN